MAGKPERSPNFGFLAEGHGSVFHDLAMAAERVFPFDPSTTLVKLRQLAEAFAKEAAATCAIPVTRDTKLLDLIRALEATRVIEREVANLFHQVRRTAIAQGTISLGLIRGAGFRVTDALHVGLIGTFISAPTDVKTNYCSSVGPLAAKRVDMGGVSAQLSAAWAPVAERARLRRQSYVAPSSSSGPGSADSIVATKS